MLYFPQKSWSFLSCPCFGKWHQDVLSFETRNLSVILEQDFSTWALLTFRAR